MTANFKLAAQREVLWPVTVHVPRDNGPAPVAIKIRYRLQTKAEKLAFEALPAAERDARVLDHITGWEGVEDMDDNPIPFSRENLVALLEHEFVAIAIAVGWRNANVGAPVKNS